MERECDECGEVFSTSPNSDQPVCHDCVTDFSKCDNCSSWFKNNGTPYCEDCQDDFKQCDRCDTWHQTDDLTYIESEDKLICEECISSHYFTCEDCEKTYRDYDSITTTSETDICINCYENNYFNCDSCDEVFHNDNYGGDGCCESCYRTNPNLHDYSYKPRPEFHGVHNPYYGIELETDDYNDVCAAAENLTGLDITESDFYLKEDGSLSGDGIEIVFHPRNLSSWQEFDFQKILSTVSDNGGKSFKTVSCGLHIHRSNRDLSTVTKIKLILFFGYCSEQIQTLAQRKSMYASFRPFKLIPDKGECYKAVKGRKHSHRRDQAINFCNSDTIEFRVFKGTLKLSTIMAYLAFSHYVVEFCKGTLLHEFIDGTTMWNRFTTNLKCQSGEAVTNLCEYLRNKNLMWIIE